MCGWLEVPVDMERASVEMVGPVDTCMWITVCGCKTAQCERSLLLLRRKQRLEIPWHAIALYPSILGFCTANDRQRRRILFGGC